MCHPHSEALAEENSLSAIVQVTLAYEELMLAHKKEVHCTVVTAQVGSMHSRIFQVMPVRGQSELSRGLRIGKGVYSTFIVRLRTHGAATPW